jgi:hypothetical protein
MKQVLSTAGIDYHDQGYMDGSNGTTPNNDTNNNSKPQPQPQP